MAWPPRFDMTVEDVVSLADKVLEDGDTVKAVAIYKELIRQMNEYIKKIESVRVNITA